MRLKYINKSLTWTVGTSALSEECVQCVADNIDYLIKTIPGFDSSGGFPSEIVQFYHRGKL
tara:strand:- start:757 stop:939 length:183 start_codon:yes stop_codon:yes gene_type:complete